MAMQGKMLQTDSWILHDTCILYTVYLWFIPILFFWNSDLPSFGLASEAMSGVKTSAKDADGDDDFASANGDNPQEDKDLYQFLDAVSLFSWGPKSSLIAQKDRWNV